MSLPYRNSKKRKTPVFILVGDGFDELEVIYFLHTFRRAGLNIKSVGLFNNLVYSSQGVGLKTDYALVDSPFDPASEYLLILPASGRHREILRQDARVKKLLCTINQGKGLVAITDDDLAAEVDEVMPLRPPYRPLAGQDLSNFVSSLTDYIVYAS